MKNPPQPPDSLSILLAIVFAFVLFLAFFGTAFGEVITVGSSGSAQGGIDYNSANAHIAVPFTTVLGGTLASTSAQVNGNGTPNHIRVILESDSGGHPANDNLGASGYITPGTGGCNLYEFDFAAPPTVAASTNYWLVYDTGTLDTTNYVDSCGAGAFSPVNKRDVSGTWNGVGWLGYEIAYITPPGAGGGGTGTTTASSTPSTAGYAPSQQEWLFMFGLVVFLLSLIAFRTLFFSI